MSRNGVRAVVLATAALAVVASPAFATLVEVDVLATDNWTPTAINLNVGDSFWIAASGQGKWGSQAEDIAGPDGFGGSPGAPAGAMTLLGQIAAGAPQTPNVTIGSNNEVVYPDYVFVSGSQFPGAADRAGYLYLGPQDTALGDNSGSVHATIGASAVPEPCSAIPLAAAGCGVLATRRRRAREPGPSVRTTQARRRVGLHRRAYRQPPAWPWSRPSVLHLDRRPGVTGVHTFGGHLPMRRAAFVGLFALLGVPAGAWNVIQVGGDISGTATWSAGDPGNPNVYVAVSRIRIGGSLTIEPGVIVKWAVTDAESHLDVTGAGHLDALGTAASPVVFTSVKDDTVGGDTNGDGGATSPAPGN